MNIPEPIKRNKLRQFLGKEFYILKRKWQWFVYRNTFSKKRIEEKLPFVIKEHKSIILRPLAGVEMYLQENKRTNLRLAVGQLNGITIAPGETFSFWKLVGRPSKRKGYIDGLVLRQGTVAKDTGGGLCQLGNLLFWMCAHSDLTITERYRHGFDVFPDVNRSVPFGSGATLSYNHIDLQIKNTTEQTFRIHLWLDDKYLNGTLTATQPMNGKVIIEEQSHQIKRQNWGGYTRHNQLFKVKSSKEGKLISEELLVENHAIMMYEPFLEAKKPPREVDLNL